MSEFVNHPVTNDQTDVQGGKLEFLEDELLQWFQQRMAAKILIDVFIYSYIIWLQVPEQQNECVNEVLKALAQGFPPPLARPQTEVF